MQLLKLQLPLRRSNLQLKLFDDIQGLYVGLQRRLGQRCVPHDVTKIQTKKLSILLSCYFLEVQQPKNLYLHKFYVLKGSSFCDCRRRLNEHESKIPKRLFSQSLLVETSRKLPPPLSDSNHFWREKFYNFPWAQALQFDRS